VRNRLFGVKHRNCEIKAAFVVVPARLGGPPFIESKREVVRASPLDLDHVVGPDREMLKDLLGVLVDQGGDQTAEAEVRALELMRSRKELRLVAAVRPDVWPGPFTVRADSAFCSDGDKVAVTEFDIREVLILHPMSFKPPGKDRIGFRLDLGGRHVRESGDAGRAGSGGDLVKPDWTQNKIKKKDDDP